MVIDLKIPVKPVPQARPRFFVRHRKQRFYIGAYDPKQCQAFKEIVAWYAKIKAKEHRLKSPLEEPISIRLTFQMGNGKGKERYHTKRPDLDNLAKAVKDALKGIIYDDDSQIVEAHLTKKYGDYAVLITIETLH